MVSCLVICISTSRTAWSTAYRLLQRHSWRQFLGVRFWNQKSNEAVSTVHMLPLCLQIYFIPSGACCRSVTLPVQNHGGLSPRGPAKYLQEKEPTVLFPERPSCNGTTDNSLSPSIDRYIVSMSYIWVYCIPNLTLPHAQESRVTIPAQDSAVRVHGKGITPSISGHMREFFSCTSITTKEFRCWRAWLGHEGRAWMYQIVRALLASLFPTILCLE